jgi:hypothetical protein
MGTWYVHVWLESVGIDLIQDGLANCSLGSDGLWDRTTGFPVRQNETNCRGNIAAEGRDVVQANLT